MSEAKALALRCKALEMQLRQSVPRRDHLEVTSKLERQIASLEKDLDRAKTETQKTIAINKQIIGVESQIAAVIRATNGLAKTLDSLDSTTSTTRKALAEQARTIDGIGAKIVQGTVPSGVHLESLSKITNLESKCEELTRQIGNMVPGREYVSLRDRFAEANRRISTMVPASELEEANRRISTMVPASDYTELKRRVDDLEATISTMVPKEQFAASEARVGELEGMLAYRVPQTVYDDLVSRVVSLAEAVTGGDIASAERAEEPQQEAVAAVVSIPASAPVAAEPEPVTEVESPVQAPVPVAAEPVVEPMVVAAEPVVEPMVVAAEPVVEPMVEAPATEAVQEAVPEVEIQQPQADVPAPAAVPVEPSPQPAFIESPVGESPEIREVQSQLAELGSLTQEAQLVEVLAAATTEEAAPETPAQSGNSAPQVVSVNTSGSEEQAAALAESSDDNDSVV